MNWYKIAQEIPHPKGYKVTANKHKEQGHDWYVPRIWFNGQPISDMPSMFEFRDEAIKAGWAWLEQELHGFPNVGSPNIDVEKK